MCLGCSKEPSHRDGSFEYPQHMFWLRNKKIIFQKCLLAGGLYSVTSIALGKGGIQFAFFSYCSTKTYVVGTHWKRLNETLPMSIATNDFMERSKKCHHFTV